ncbi:hypothetical protein D1007_53136 [Hordeum vulgare]|nr:hypothetical protein D1007_53136 [Hordeum vulgare]
MKVEVSDAKARKACECTFRKAEEAAESREAAEAREKELQASNAILEHQLQEWRVEVEGACELTLREATVVTKLASLHGQVGSAASLVERAADEAKEAGGLQRLHSKVFEGLDHRVCQAVGSICGGRISSPLVPDDVGYLDFFTKVVEQLEVDAKQVGILIEEESRDLLSEALMHVFNNVFCTDPTLILRPQ